MSLKNNLIPGESFIPRKKQQSLQNSSSDEEVNNKYTKGDIRIITEQARYPLDTIPGMLGSKKYILNPEYQRRKRWDQGKKSRLIESFIMNVPIPPIFLYEVDYSIYEVMDGLQRLTAINDFYLGKFELKGLEYWQELNGRTYETLPEKIKRGIDRRYLSSIVLLQETAKSDEEAEFLKQIVFERLNSGGEKLTPQETRNALQSGKFNQSCIKLAQNEKFREMWDIPLESEGEEKLLESAPYREMEDVLLVLRFFAYRHIEHLIGGDKFLDEFLKQANQYSKETITQLKVLFNDTVELIYFIFGKNAFFLPPSKREYKKPVKTIYDPMMQAFAMNIGSKKLLQDNAKEIKEKIYEVFPSSNEGKKKLFDGRYNNRNDVKERIEFYNKFLKNYTS